MHPVRIREDVWIALQFYLGDKSFQQFIDEVVVEKIGFTQRDIEETEKEIARLQDLNKKRTEYMKLEKSYQDDIIQHRERALDGILEKPWNEWTALNKRHALEAGKFKDPVDLGEWVTTYQRNNHR